LRIIKSLVAAAAVAAVAAGMAVAPAMAEPINPHTGKLQNPPNAWDIVGVGSESTTFVVGGLTYAYDSAIKKDTPANPYIYSWDAVPPGNMNDTTQQIVVKHGCKKNLRPNGSSAGITALVGGYGNTSYTYKGKKHTVPCLDFARSSRPRKTTDPSFGPGGVAFVVMAGDAVTYSATNLKGEKTNVPNNLSLAQLAEIFGCTVPKAHGFNANTWGALLGSGAKGASQAIDPILPQAGSGTLSFWATTALGLTSTSEPTCGSAASLSTPNQPEENEGTSNVFRIGDKKTGKPNPNVIYPFSVGAFVAQAYHDAKCGHKPTKKQNRFGCDINGILGLDGISGVVPTVKGPGGIPVTNPKWSSTKFHRFLYNVVPYATTADHIPSYLEKFIGRKGYFCKQTTILKDYGFEPTAGCGLTS